MPVALVDPAMTASACPMPDAASSADVLSAESSCERYACSSSRQASDCAMRFTPRAITPNSAGWSSGNGSTNWPSATRCSACAMRANGAASRRLLYQKPRPSTAAISKKITLAVGAIGGSIARQVKQPGKGEGITVIGWSPEPAERALAAQHGAIDDAPARAADVARAADLLILAAPPAANLTHLETLVASLKR